MHQHCEWITMASNDPATVVTLTGGPLDGWPLIVRGELPAELSLPYSRAMLELAGESGVDRAALRERWLNVTFPSEVDADGIALYHRMAGSEPPRYAFAGHRQSRGGPP